MVGLIKSNILVIVFVLIALVVPPAGFVVSSGWNKSIRESQQKKASSDLQKVTRASVTYSIPATFPNEESVEVKGAPNAVLTAWFKENRAALEVASAELIEGAVEFNRRGHGVLIEGLLPEPSSDREGQQLGYTLADMIVGTGETRSVYQELLDGVRAGGPVDPDGLRSDLVDLRDRQEREYLKREGVSEVPEEERARITSRLIEGRRARYRRRANAYSVYANVDSLRGGVKPGVGGNHWSLIPTGRPDVVSVETAFAWHFDYWMMDDLLAAIARANTTEDGSSTTLEESAVKRIDGVRLEILPIEDGNRLVDNAPRVSSDDGLAPTNSGLSLTGRVSSPDNQVYDVRHAELELVVASAKLSRVLRAFGQTNFMTVLEMDVEPIDAWEELGRGYYWGSDHVVKLKLLVETVWLREWTTKLMPKGVADALGVRLPEGDSEDDDYS